MARKNEKTTKKTMIRSLGDDALEAVTGGATSQPHRSPKQQAASIKMAGLAADHKPGSALNLFFAAAAVA